MREPAFLRKSKDKWLAYEKELQSQKAEMDADRLAELYIQLTDDLAYARTFYPKSKLVKYLNGLAARTHLMIYQNKKQKGKRWYTYWKTELPLLNWEARKYFLYSGLIFLACLIIGLVSALHDLDFVRMIMGDSYVNMTIENIRKGNPLGVYESMPQVQMFLMIAFNNLLVILQIYAMGIFLSVGTIMGFPGWVSGLFQNGIMIGAFLGFFNQYNLFWEAIPIIYVHGTLELSAIVIGGGAGLMLGNSLLFPGTYTRMYSLQVAAQKSVKIIVGLVPIIIMAAFLESFVTRLTDMPLIFKIGIIVLSLGFMLWYYVFYPFYVHRSQSSTP